MERNRWQPPNYSSMTGNSSHARAVSLILIPCPSDMKNFEEGRCFSMFCVFVAVFARWKKKDWANTKCVCVCVCCFVNRIRWLMRRHEVDQRIVPNLYRGEEQAKTSAMMFEAAIVKNWIWNGRDPRWSECLHGERNLLRTRKSA